MVREKTKKDIVITVIGLTTIVAMILTRLWALSLVVLILVALSNESKKTERNRRGVYRGPRRKPLSETVAEIGEGEMSFMQSNQQDESSSLDPSILF